MFMTKNGTSQRVKEAKLCRAAYTVSKGVGTMTISKVQDGKKMTFCVEGNLDNNTSPEFLKFFNGSVDGIDELVLDLAKLEYLSSAGIRVLITAQKTMNKKGKMTIVNVTPDIMDVFDLTGLSNILNVIE